MTLYYIHVQHVQMHVWEWYGHQVKVGMVTINMHFQALTKA